jgi:hypothetical protein
MLVELKLRDGLGVTVFLAQLIERGLVFAQFGKQRVEIRGRLIRDTREVEDRAVGRRVMCDPGDISANPPRSPRLRGEAAICNRNPGYLRQI